MKVRTVLLGLMAALCGGVGPVATPADAASQEPLVIQEQGSFSVGGTVLTSAGTYEPNNPTAAGQTYHGDHAYAFFQVPAHARKVSARVLAWRGPVHKNMGNDAGWPRGLSEHFFAAWL
jgi:hypothetical protein